jgi:glutathione S-transferase
MSGINLYYWDLRGLNEPIVTLLEYVGAQYTLHKVTCSRQEWYNQFEGLVKKGLTFPNLPYIEHNGKYHSESWAIMCHVASVTQRMDLFPCDETFVRFMELNGVIGDLNGAFTGPGYRCKSMDELKSVLIETLQDTHGSFHQLDLILSKNQWLLGKNLCLVDFKFAELIERIQTMEEDLGLNIFSQFENLRAYLGRFLGLPAIKEYRNSPKFKPRPWNNVQALWK